MRTYQVLLALLLMTQIALAEVKIGPGGEFIVGGFDPSSKEDADRHVAALEKAMPGLKRLGVTSHEVYVRWGLCEVEPGKWDWSVYDKYFELYKRNDIKCVPFLICGSPYSLPNWYYKKPGSQGYVCLEHGEESDVQSLWNPKMREHVAAFVKAFCEHYRDTGRIEAILLGITGNYGEAIYPATGNDWTADVHGKYHTHAGFWCGDPFAVEDFRAWLKKKYPTSDAYQRAWGEKAPDLATLKPFKKKDAPNDRAWIDQVDWYTESMTNYTKFWVGEVRKNFSGGIYVCTGGHAPPEHGADFGEQCKAAAEVHAGVRITNEASDYKLNFSLTRWVASAGTQYGAYYSFEPAGGVDEKGVVARIYNATTSGAKGLHYYYGNLFDRKEATQRFVDQGANFTQRKPITEIAVYYPSTHIKLHGSIKFLESVRPLRDRFDFIYLSDRQILDGGLSQVKAMIITLGSKYEASVLQQIAKWQEKGGLLIYPEQLGPFSVVEGAQVKFAGGTAVFPGAASAVEYRDFICKTLSDLKSLSSGTKAMLKLDGKEDNIFVTLTGENEALWYDANQSTIKSQRISP